MLRYLRVTQEADGHWSQNMWLDGTPYWHGIQMDETALPILLVDLAAREGVLDAARARRVLADGAAGRRVSRPQRSREPAGSLGGRPWLLAVHARRRDRRAAGRRRPGRRGGRHDGRDVSARNRRRLERQHRTTGCTSPAPTLARQHGVDGYYVRVAEPDRADAASPCHGFVPIKNRPPDQSTGPAALMVSPDALALVRFGLRARRRSAHREHGQGHRRDAQGRHAARARPGIATTATATASTPTAGRSTAPASAAPGRC